MLARLRDKLLVLVTILAIILGIALNVMHHRIANDAARFTPYVERFTPTVESLARSGVASEASVAGASQPVPALKPLETRRTSSQLIRTANISVQVEDVSKALQAASLITVDQIGDVINLNDDTPESPSDAHSATMEIRVPVDHFDRTLNALGKLGKVKARSVSAQDASDQIIDMSARLRNLRRTERDMLAIMDRSGTIDQVLQVTQQLSSVREQIEQLDAQLQSTKYQVAYSTIDITLSSPAVLAAPTSMKLLSDAWLAAVASLRNFTISLLSLGLWLVAFSPYIAAVALVAALALRRRRRGLAT